MSNLIRIFIIFIFSALLSACFKHTSMQPDYAISETELTTWNGFTGIEAAKEQQIAAKAIVDYIHEQHGFLKPQFPYLKVRSVKISHAKGSAAGFTTKNKQKTEKALGTIFKMVEYELFVNQSSSSQEIWPTDVIVSIYPPIGSSELVPPVALCWGKDFFVCPSINTQIVSVEIIAHSPAGEVLKTKGIGASEFFMQSQLDNAYSKFAKEQNMKALIAAVADAENKWVFMWKAI